MSSNTVLRHEFDREIKALAEHFHTLPWHDQAFYACWLAQTCFLVRHTTRLLGFAAGMFGVDQNSWHCIALDGLKEERDHDKLAENDLKHLGYSIADFPELAQTSAIYQSQYYRVQHTGPKSLFGYALMLEGLTAKIGADFTKQLSDYHGPRSATFMRVHAVHDSDHYAEGLEALADVTADEARGIIANLLQSRVLYVSMLEAVAQTSASSAFSKSA